MTHEDIQDLDEMLSAVLGVYGRQLGETQSAIWFAALSAHDFVAVRKALADHVGDPQAGRFAPTPADILGRLQRISGHPGPEEAWAKSLAAQDERATVVWTPEMAQAWQVAAPLVASGDQVGARMAFKEAYGRLVDEARSFGRPARWTASLGWDSSRRVEVVEQAAAAGLLPAPEAAALLEGAKPTPMPATVAQRLAEIRERAAARIKAQEGGL